MDQHFASVAREMFDLCVGKTLEFTGSSELLFTL